METSGLVYLDKPEDERAAQLLQYWHDKRGAKALPDRADIHPPEIPHLLPYILLADPVEGGEDFRIRLFGTALVELMQEERTGKLISQIGLGPLTVAPKTVRSRWLEITRKAFREVGPVICKTQMSSSRRNYITVHGISLPLTRTGNVPEVLLGGIFPEMDETA